MFVEIKNSKNGFTSQWRSIFATATTAMQVTLPEQKKAFTIPDYPRASCHSGKVHDHPTVRSPPDWGVLPSRRQLRRSHTAGRSAARQGWQNWDGKEGSGEVAGP